MPKIVDWSGQKFYYITFVSKLNAKNKYNRWLWLAICECGTQLNVEPIMVKRGSIKHCGCKKLTTSKDWTGKKFNKLTFKKPCGRTIGSKIKWQVNCDCGNSSIVIPHDVSSGKIKTCGKCERHSTIKNWNGVRQGILTFQNLEKISPKGTAIWKAECDCGTIIYTIPSNNAQSCGCASRKNCQFICKIPIKRKSKYLPNESAARKVWQRYKDGDIDFNSFKKLSQLPCYYCGINPQTTYTYKKGSFTYNGLDRKDSGKNHTLSNCVTCCMDCNRSKLDKTIDDFIAHANRIVKFQSKRASES